MCIHVYNLHSCGCHTRNLDHSINSHCTRVQRLLYHYHDQIHHNSFYPPPTHWAITCPRTCPLFWPHGHNPPVRLWNQPISEENIEGWGSFHGDEVDEFLRTNRTANYQWKFRHFTRRMARPSVGDGRPNVHLVQVPWGCGLNAGVCSAGLTGRRCSEKEIDRMTYALGRYRVIKPWLNEDEVQLAVLEEIRIRYLEDVRAIELGTDSATRVGLPDWPSPDDYVEIHRMLSRVIHWQGIGNVFNRKPLSQLWGAADTAGSLILSPGLRQVHPIGRPVANQSRTHTAHNDPRVEAPGSFLRSFNALLHRGHPDSHSVVPNTDVPNGAGNAQKAPAPERIQSPRGGSSQQTVAATNIQSPPGSTVAPTTDLATLLAYHGVAYPIHTGTPGRPIIDGTDEYQEAREVFERQPPTRMIPKSCPNIVTDSGKLILKGCSGNIAVVEDGLIDLVKRHFLERPRD